MKKVFFIFMLFISTVLLVACNEAESYSLTLPSEVSASVENINEITKDTMVTLTISLPSGKSLEWLKINDVEVEVQSLKYSFKINQDTVVLVSFKDIDVKETYSLTLPDEVKSDQVDNTIISSSTLVTLTIETKEGFILEWLKVNDVSVEVSNNTYKFNISKDTIVTIKYKEKELDKEYYSLKIPTDLTSNLSDLSAILEGTEITLTFNKGINFILETMTINGVNVQFTNDSYTFEIFENTVVTTTYKVAGIQPVEYLEILKLLNNANYDMFSDNGQVTIEVPRILFGTEVVLITSMLDNYFIGETAVIIDGLINTYYNDGSIFNYVWNNVNGEDERTLNQMDYIVSKQDTEVINENMPGLLSIVDLMDGLYKELVNILTDITSNYPDITLTKDGSNQKLIFKISTNELLENAILGSLYESYFGYSEMDMDYQITFEMNFNQDNKLLSLSINTSFELEDELIDFNIVLKKSNAIINLPDEIKNFDNSEKDKQVPIYLGEEVVMYIPYINIIDFNDSYTLERFQNNLYFKDVIVEGFYLDEELTNLITTETNLENTESIYIKTKPKVTIEELIEKIDYENEYLFKYLYTSSSYMFKIKNFEGFLDGGYIRFYDEITKKNYSALYQSNIWYIIDGIVENSILSNDIKNVLNDVNTYIPFKNSYLVGPYLVNTNTNEVRSLFDSFAVEIIEENDAKDILERIYTTLTLDNIVILNPKIDYITPDLSETEYISINDLDTVNFYVRYSNGFNVERTLEELIAAGHNVVKPSDVDDHLLVDDIVIWINLYDANDGQFILVTDKYGVVTKYYLSDLTSLPQVEGSFFQKDLVLTHLDDSGNTDIATLEELKTFIGNKDYLDFVITSNYVTIDELFMKLDENNYYLPLYNNIIYDFKTNQYYDSSDIVYEVTQTHLIIIRNDFYEAIPLEKVNKNANFELHIRESIVVILLFEKLLNNEYTIYYEEYGHPGIIAINNTNEKYSYYGYENYFHLEEVFYIQESQLENSGYERVEYNTFENEVRFNTNIGEEFYIIVGFNSGIYYEPFTPYEYIITRILNTESLEASADGVHLTQSGIYEISYLRNISAYHTLLLLTSYDYITFYAEEYEYQVKWGEQIIISEYGKVIGLVDLINNQQYMFNYNTLVFEKIGELSYFKNIHTIVEQLKPEDVDFYGGIYTTKEVEYNSEHIFSFKVNNNITLKILGMSYDEFDLIDYETLEISESYIYFDININVDKHNIDKSEVYIRFYNGVSYTTLLSDFEYNYYYHDERTIVISITINNEEIIQWYYV